MNPNLDRLHPYPFEKLKRLNQGIAAPKNKSHIALSIGEPKHPTPVLIRDNLDGLAKYPTTKGLPELRTAIANWVSKRFNIPARFVDVETQILPVNGTREALFSFVQAVVDLSKEPVVIMPNPFYQIYEGAAILAGAEPYFLNTTESSDYLPDFDSIPEDIWRRCQVIFICSPGNPTGEIIPKETQQRLISLAEKYDFIIASDECYTELYDDEMNPPQGLLQTGFFMGNTAYKHCIIFQSLSKRSNAPGLRSGFVAGNADILAKFFQYRTYHGCALPLPTQFSSIAAWTDEAHVKVNRELYRQKFSAFINVLFDVCKISKPPASFYLWLKTPIDDIDFAQQLFEQQNVSVLPGQFLSRDVNGANPGKNHVRIALVAPVEECIEAAKRIKNFIHTLD